VFKTFYTDALANIEAWLDGKPTNVLNRKVLQRQ